MVSTPGSVVAGGKASIGGSIMQQLKCEVDGADDEYTIRFLNVC